MRSYSSRVMVCLVAFVESSTTKVERVLRESTLALTTTLPNSVTWLFGIFSVSTRSRSVVGFHSTDAALTSYTTTSPPPDACGGLFAPGLPAAAQGRALYSRDLGSVPRQGEVKDVRHLRTGR